MATGTAATAPAPQVIGVEIAPDAPAVEQPPAAPVPYFLVANLAKDIRRKYGFKIWFWLCLQNVCVGIVACIVPLYQPPRLVFKVCIGVFSGIVNVYLLGLLHLIRDRAPYNLIVLALTIPFEGLFFGSFGYAFGPSFAMSLFGVLILQELVSGGFFFCGVTENLGRKLRPKAPGNELVAESVGLARATFFLGLPSSLVAAGLPFALMPAFKDDGDLTTAITALVLGSLWGLVVHGAVARDLKRCNPDNYLYAVVSVNANVFLVIFMCAVCPMIFSSEAGIGDFSGEMTLGEVGGNVAAAGALSGEVPVADADVLDAAAVVGVGDGGAGATAQATV